MGLISLGVWLYYINMKKKPHHQTYHLFWLSEEFGSSGIDDELPNARFSIARKTPIWYEYIAKFLSTQQYHEGLDKNQHYKIRVNNSHFALITGNR